GEAAAVSDGRWLFELVVHVKRASEAMIAAARNLAALEPTDPTAAEALAWVRTVDGLSAMNLELGSMERILRSATQESLPPRARKTRALASERHAGACRVRAPPARRA